MHAKMRQSERTGHERTRDTLLNVGAEHADLARRVSDRCRLEGEFKLRSGQTATAYFDKYLFEGDPVILRDVAAAMVPLAPPRTAVLAGLELGGVPVATALSLATGLPTAFVRKKAKSYGTARLAEGADIEGRRVLVVEDVITTGGQVVSSTRDLRHRGAIVDEVLCVIDRSDGDLCSSLWRACALVWASRTLRDQGRTGSAHRVSFAPLEARPSAARPGCRPESGPKACASSRRSLRAMTMGGQDRGGRRSRRERAFRSTGDRGRAWPEPWTGCLHIDSTRGSGHTDHTAQVGRCGWVVLSSRHAARRDVRDSNWS
jgi:orotate phosphoribosyltransferase